MASIINFDNRIGSSNALKGATLYDGKVIGRYIPDGTNTAVEIIVKLLPSKPATTSVAAPSGTPNKYYVALAERPQPFPYPNLENKGYLLRGSDYFRSMTGGLTEAEASYFVTSAQLATLQLSDAFPLNEAVNSGVTFVLPDKAESSEASKDAGVAYTATAVNATTEKPLNIRQLEEINRLKAELAAKSNTGILTASSGTDTTSTIIKWLAWGLLGAGVFVLILWALGVFKKKGGSRRKGGLLGGGKQDDIYYDASGRPRSKKTGKWV